MLHFEQKKKKKKKKNSSHRNISNKTTTKMKYMNEKGSSNIAQRTET